MLKYQNNKLGMLNYSHLTWSRLKAAVEIMVKSLSQLRCCREVWGPYKGKFPCYKDYFRNQRVGIKRGVLWQA